MVTETEGPIPLVTKLAIGHSPEPDLFTYQPHNPTARPTSKRPPHQYST